MNLNGVFHTIQAVLPDMLEAGWGRIVNISSSSTHSGPPFQDPLRRREDGGQRTDEIARAGIWSTRHHRQRGPAGLRRHADVAQAEERQLLGGTIEDHIEGTPVRRVGRPEDLAATCAFLISEDAGYITGQILGVNGGRRT